MAPIQPAQEPGAPEDPMFYIPDPRLLEPDLAVGKAKCWPWTCGDPARGAFVTQKHGEARGPPLAQAAWGAFSQRSRATRFPYPNDHFHEAGAGLPGRDLSFVRDLANDYF